MVAPPGLRPVYVIGAIEFISAGIGIAVTGTSGCAELPLQRIMTIGNASAVIRIMPPSRIVGVTDMSS
jgi:hypothetical protein